MASLVYGYPQLFLNEPFESPDVRQQPAGSGHTGTSVIQFNDIVTSAAGVLTRAATNTSGTIFGLTVHGEQQIWGNVGGNTSVGPNSLFGWVMGSGVIIPTEPANVHVNPLFNLPIEMSLRNDATVSCGWISGGTNQVTYGTQLGLYLDATTNLFVLDPTQTNKVCTVYDKPFGPTALLPGGQYLGKGYPGDTGARVYVKFLSTVLI